MEIDEVGIDKVGIDKVGITWQDWNNPLSYILTAQQ